MSRSSNGLRLFISILICGILAACGTSDDATSVPPTVDEAVQESSTSEDTATEMENTSSEIDITEIELPDTPDDLEGITIDIIGVEDGFSMEDVPVRVLSVQCFGPAIGWILNDDTTNAPPQLQMNLSISADAQAGTFELAQSNPDEDTVGVGINISEENATGVVQFTSVQSGAIRLDSLPTAEGETLTGAFQLNVRPSQIASSSEGDDREQELQIIGLINVTAEADQICDPEE